jgi:hypothetical protein
MLSKAKHLAFSSGYKGEILRLRLRMTLRHSLMGEKVIGKGRFEKQVPFRLTVNETFDVSCDLVSPVSDQYESPFAFTGKIKRILVDISNKALKSWPRK